MARKRKTIIHVNRHKIEENRTHGTREPVITVKSGRQNRYCHSVEILGPSRMVYRPDKPLSCGAVAWIETYADVLLDGVNVELPSDAGESLLTP